MKKLIMVLMLVASFMLLVGCAQNTTKTTKDNTTNTTGIKTSKEQTTIKEDNTNYIDIVYAPKYSEINDTNYTSYYFDSEFGNDENDGLTISSPKRSIAEANRLISRVKINTPTKVLFKGTFVGQLKVQGFDASDERPLIVSSYGNTQALFDGNGEEQAIILTGSNVRIINLEVTNPTGRKGIYIYTIGERKNVVVEECYIHNVNWNWTESESEESYASHLDDLGIEGVNKVDPLFKYETGGIIFDTCQDQVSFLENVWIKDNRFEKVSRSGVFLTSQWVKCIGVGWGVNPYCDDEHGYYPSKNVNFVGNFANITGGDGFVMVGVKGGYFESNISYNANYLGRSGTANVGMWPISSSDIVMQFNEGAYAKLRNGGADGEGFDIDIGCKNITFQYNYSHDNDGPAILLCNVGSTITKYDEDGEIVKENGRIVQVTDIAEWTNCIIRNNVFVNNGLKPGHPTLAHLAGPVFDTLIENNTIIYSNETQQLFSITKYDEWGGPDRFTFKNNIFYSNTENDKVLDLTNFGDEYMFVSNLYYNLSDGLIEAFNESKAITFDPGFDQLVGVDGFENVELFIPTNNQCFIKGLKLKTKNKYDILLNETVGAYYLGAIAKR